MNDKGLRQALCLLCLMSLPGLAWSWWNDQWTSRKQIGLDASVTGADLKTDVDEFPLLLRLHTGNFGYFAELAENGKDLRFAADDKTALKHAVERFDAVNEMALVWVKVPKFKAGTDGATLWMYYGNASAQEGGDSKGVYDANQALTLHFDEKESLPQDATAYGNHAASSGAVIDPNGWIGAAARFDGRGTVEVKASPSLEMRDQNGWTFSAWVKIETPQQNAVMFRAQDGSSKLELAVNGTAVGAVYQDVRNTGARIPATDIGLGKWRFVALVVRGGTLELYLDGAPAGTVKIDPLPMNPALFVGGSDAHAGFVGWLDEVQVAHAARSPDWLKLAFRSQSPDFNVFTLGQDEAKGSSGGPNYFAIILQSLTVDGWVVIALCGVMFIVSSLVMILKGLLLSRAQKDNRAFLEQYRAMDSGQDIAALDAEETEEDKEAAESDVLATLVGKHDHFQSSPIYHVYHAGVQELKKRYGQSGQISNRPFSEEAANVLRARLDAAVVREGQRLNRHMVLLTIAISGGPFLGLLGTVLGVMITFAVIAATGDVNINSIAPGISGALLATVAGLAVAIPALFGYNYLLTQIKDLTADMRVFTDEFLAQVSERIADRQRGG